MANTIDLTNDAAAVEALAALAAAEPAATPAEPEATPNEPEVIPATPEAEPAAAPEEQEPEGMVFTAPDIVVNPDASAFDPITESTPIDLGVGLLPNADYPVDTWGFTSPLRKEVRRALGRVSMNDMKAECLVKTLEAALVFVKDTLATKADLTEGVYEGRE